MRQLVVMGSLVCALALAAPTGAGERSWYLGFEGGVELDGGGSNYGEDDSGWAGLVTVGTGVTSHISLEAELGYRTVSSDYSGGLSSGVDQTTLMLNAVYETSLTKDVALAIGVGVGGAQVDYEYYWGGSHSDIEIAAQLKLGVSVAVSESTELVANYRYIEVFRTYADDSTLTVGIRFAL